MEGRALPETTRILYVVQGKIKNTGKWIDIASFIDCTLNAELFAKNVAEADGYFPDTETGIYCATRVVRRFTCDTELYTYERPNRYER